METLERKTLTDREFEAKVKQYKGALLNHAKNLAKTQDDAEDLLQDTLARGYHYKSKYLFDYSFYGWLRRIMTNLFINNYHRKKHPTVTQDLFGDELVSKIGGYHEDNSGYQSLLEEEIQREINKLEKKHKESFVLYCRGHKYQEIAVKLNLPLGTVKNRIHIARRILKGRVYVN